MIYRPKKSCSEDLPSMIALLIMRKYRHVFEGNKKKYGKIHHYWSVVENVRVGRRVFQRCALYLGELNGSQHAECKELLRLKNDQNGRWRNAHYRWKNRDPPSLCRTERRSGVAFKSFRINPSRPTTTQDIREPIRDIKTRV